MIQKIKKKKYFYRAMVIFAAVLSLLGTFLPGWILVRQSGKEMNMVDAVPVEYYSAANLAVARNASANLGIYQKLQLITGKWKSNVSETDSGERQMQDFEAVTLVKEQMDALYEYGLYPVSLRSDYENWYSWEAEFCKVVDATFNTYAAYFWKFTFAKYDGTEKHRVYMLEDGTIFLAEALGELGFEGESLTNFSGTRIKPALGLTGITSVNAKDAELKIEELLAFSDVETKGLEWLDLARLAVNDREYYMLQASSENIYVISMQPVE